MAGGSIGTARVRTSAITIMVLNCGQLSRWWIFDKRLWMVVAEVHPSERCNHTNDIWMLHIAHYFHFLKVAILVHFVGELFLL